VGIMIPPDWIPYIKYLVILALGIVIYILRRKGKITNEQLERFKELLKQILPAVPDEQTRDILVAIISLLRGMTNEGATDFEIYHALDILEKRIREANIPNKEEALMAIKRFRTYYERR